MSSTKTLHFPDTPSGQRQKVRAINKEEEKGWRLVAETITQGKRKNNQACCFATICLPCGFLAGTTKGVINVTLQQEKVIV